MKKNNEEDVKPALGSAKSGEQVTGGKENLGFVGNDRIGISFVCTYEECGTRVSKSVGRLSYNKGTVVIQCPGCKKHHVIADNTGMYSDLTDGKVNIEEIAKAKGESVTRVDNDIFKSYL